MQDYIPLVPPLFQTSLSFPFEPNDPSFTIASDLMLNGVPLSGLICASIDIGQPNPEYVIGTLLNNVVTVIARNIDPLHPLSAGPMPSQEHRRGASVKITDFSSICIMRNLLNGTQGIQNPLYYLTHPNFTQDTQLIDKKYADDLFILGVILPNMGTPVSGNSGGTPVTNETITVTTNGNDRYLIAKFALQSSETITGAPTYDGVPMTLLGALNQGGVRIEVWGILNPTLGTHPLSVNFSGPTVVEWDIIPFFQVDQITPLTLGTPAGGNSNTSANSLLTTTNNSLLLHFLATKLVGVIYTQGAGESIVASSLTGFVQGAIEAQGVATPAATASSIGLSAATDWANMILALNGISTPGASYKVKVSNTDTTPDFLENKIVDNALNPFPIINPGGNEKLKINATGGSSGGGAAGTEWRFPDNPNAVGVTTVSVVGLSNVTTYTVPGGKRLYITSVEHNNNGDLMIDGLDIAIDYFQGQGAPGQALSNPIIVEAGSVISGDPVANSNIVGFLVDSPTSLITVITQNVDNVAKYTVPVGKTFVLMNANTPTLVALKVTPNGGALTEIGQDINNQTAGWNPGIPMFFHAGDVIEADIGGATINGYEVNEGVGFGGTVVDKQVFTTSGVWTKPAWAKMVKVITLGAGGGAGSGSKSSPGFFGSGGGAGGGGEKREMIFQASQLGVTEAVTIGAGGLGGVSQVANGTQGNDGVDGGDTSFGAWLTAKGGKFGQGGQNGGNNSNGGGGGSSVATLAIGNGIAGQGAGRDGNAEYGGAGGDTSHPQAQGSSGGSSLEAGAGGGSGGTNDITGAPTYYQPGDGGKQGSYSNGGGGAAGISQNAATDGTDGSNTLNPYAGTGGGGGGASNTQNAGKGGKGGIACGGGGGGSSVDGAGDSGAGGLGGDGITIIYAW